MTTIKCSYDEKNTVEGSHLEEYTSLTANKDSLRFGDSTKITANADGEKLTYIWNTNNNAPVNHTNDPSVVYFYADPCTGIGITKVYCTVKANNKSERKQIDIHIIE